MKKITAIILAVSIMGAYSVFAAEEAPTTDVTIAHNENLNTKRTVSGEVKSVSDEQIELSDLILTIDEATLIADYQLMPIDGVEEGDIITAVADTKETRSIPAQSYAYYILVQKNENEVPPIYAAVEENEDGYITSQDGMYRISYENADVTMYKTKNIVKAEELGTDSEIFVYASMMTMSIPALVNPEKIVVLYAGDDEAEQLEGAGILKGTENGLELHRDVTRAEAVALLQRTNGAAAARSIANSEFTDVPHSHWAYAAISWAKEQNIIEGLSENLFGADRTVTGREFVKMLLCATGDSNVTIENAYEKGIEAGIVPNSIKNKVDKNKFLTRNDVAKIIYAYTCIEK